MVDDHYAGFALIRKITGCNEEYYSVAEFFIMKKYRQKNIGKQAAYEIFNMHKGIWHVFQHEQNQTAQKFWRNIIGEFTEGNYKELSRKESGVEGPCQRFKT